MRNLIAKLLKGLVVLALMLVIGFAAWVYFSTYHPDDIQQEQILVSSDRSQLKGGQSLKVLSWNVQFMAGNRDNFFFYDGGPDGWPQLQRVEQTIQQVADVITTENPDVVMLQEVDELADRTHNTDQQQMLLALLSEDYAYQTSTYYWKADFVPHPQIMGSAGMKLVVFSKYPISQVIRHSLPQITSDDIVTRQFNLKRAIQQVVLPIDNGKQVHLLNTHLSAFAKGTDTMQRQVAKVLDVLDQLEDSWVIGGDFNLLVDDSIFTQLPPQHQAYYNEKGTELSPLLAKYASIPSKQQLLGVDKAKWFTYMPSDDPKRQPNRAIDYLFYSPQLQLGQHHVIQGEAELISDHLPVVASFTLPE